MLERAKNAWSAFPVILLWWLHTAFKAVVGLHELKTIKIVTVQFRQTTLHFLKASHNLLVSSIVPPEMKFWHISFTLILFQTYEIISEHKIHFDEC